MLKFKDLPIRATFQFAPSKTRILEYRPVYCKVSARKYELRQDHVGGTKTVQTYQVGSINVEVEEAFS